MGLPCPQFLGGACVSTQAFWMVDTGASKDQADVPYTLYRAKGHAKGHVKGHTKGHAKGQVKGCLVKVMQKAMRKVRLVKARSSMSL